MLKLGWFSTGRDRAARELLSTMMRKKEEGFFDISIEFVFCNWEEGEAQGHRDYQERKKFFKLVKSYDIPLVTLSWKKYLPELRESDKEGWRAEYGRKMREMLSGYDFDLGVLAGYMLWVDDETCNAYDLINLHPALPGGPKGTWQEVIWELIRKRAADHGAMIHLCTPEWDEGPPLTYCEFSLRTGEYFQLWEDIQVRLEEMSMEEIIEEMGEDDPLFKKIRKDGEVRELPLLAYSIRLFSEGKVQIEDDKLYQGDEPLDHPYDLTVQVNEALEKGEF